MLVVAPSIGMKTVGLLEILKLISYGVTVKTERFRPLAPYSAVIWHQVTR